MEERERLVVNGNGMAGMVVEIARHYEAVQVPGKRHYGGGGAGNGYLLQVNASISTVRSNIRTKHHMPIDNIREKSLTNDKPPP